MIKKLVIMGANNPEIIRVIEDINSVSKSIEIIGWVDNDEKKHGKEFWSLPILGSPDILNKEEYKDCHVFNNITRNGVVRKDTTTQLSQYNLPFLTLVHPKVNTRFVKIGRGVCIQEGVILQSGVVVEDHAYIASAAAIGHETCIEKYVFVGMGAVLAGLVNVGESATIWTAATIAPRLKIGEEAIIGINSAVLNNVKPKASVLGNPAKDISLFINKD